MTTGVLPFEDLKKKVHLNTGFFETSQYTEDAQMYVTSGNHDQAGLSIGNLQYNFGQADRAQEWFKYMIDNHVSIVNSAFGANTVELAEFKNVINTYTRTNRIAWGDSISALVDGEKRALQSPYKEAFGTMLISPEGKAKYYQMKDAYYWNPSYELFRHLPCVSRIALGSLFDTYVNKGRYYPVNLIVADFDAIDANGALTEVQKEFEKNYAINYRGNYDNAVNPNVNAWDGSIDQVIFWHGIGVDDGRRGCMANQEGVYYGANYDSEVNFDLNQEPATDEKVGADPINVNLGDVPISNIYLGETQISKLYLGATLLGGGEVSPVTSSRVPKTQFRTNPASYLGIPNQSAVTLEVDQPLWIDCQEPFVGCRTYYTTDGSEPTEASNLYNNALTFGANTTLKVKTISVFGIAEPTKTLTVTVNVPVTGWRYVRVIGYGDQTGTGVTTRIVEIKALEGATNRLQNKLPMAGYATPDLGTIGVATDGTIVHSSGYPLWWQAKGVPSLVYDLGAAYPIDTLLYVGYSPSWDQRQTKFILDVSEDNVSWTNVINYSNNTTPQPEAGFSFAI
jgi:Chitobiase/beta-hexosaminidase C-terminal domain